MVSQKAIVRRRRHMSNSIVFDAALQYAAHGRSVIYIEPGTKYPRNIKGGWTQYQTATATPRQIRAWFQGKERGLCITTGAGSGYVGPDGTVYGLEIEDFDESGLYEEWCQEAGRIGLGDLITRLPAETTPSGGAHIGYLCATIEGNQKLAMRDATAPELAIDPNQRVKVRIETRGEGGLCIVAPTPPGVHPTVPERGYEMLRGSWAKIPIITPEEREQLLDIARSYQTSMTIEQSSATAKKTRAVLQTVNDDPTRPGGDLNMQADRAWWAALLTPHGWTLLYTRPDGIEMWRRPGKEGLGASATLGATGNGLYVFSTSAAPLEGQRVYNPFSAYIRLEHNGDTTAATKTLAALGYGSPTRRTGQGEQRNSDNDLLTIADDLLTQLREANAPSLRQVFQASKTFAQLSTEDWNPIKAELKAMLGDQLNLNDLEKARKEAQRQRAQRGNAAATATPETKPEIHITTEMGSVVNAAQDAILRDTGAPALFHRAHGLVFISKGGSSPHALIRPPDSPMIAEATVTYLRERMAESATFLKYDKKEDDWVSALPPEWVPDTLLARKHWTFPPLEGMISSPTMRLDGTILETQGYDHETGLFLLPHDLHFPAIPTDPAKEDAHNAAHALLEVFIDFKECVGCGVHSIASRRTHTREAVQRLAEACFRLAADAGNC